MPRWPSDSRRERCGRESPEAGRKPRQAGGAVPSHSRPQAPGERRLHLGPVDDQVEHPVLEQELRALEALRQRLPDRLLDHARAGEADQRVGLRDVQVAEHRVGGRHAARRRVGHDRDVRDPPSASRASAAEIFAICMSDRMPSCMRAPPEVETRIRGRRSASARSAARVDLLAHDRAHRAGHEEELHGADDDRNALERARPDDDRVRGPDVLFRVAQPVAVLLAVAELQRIRGAQVRVELDVFARRRRASAGARAPRGGSGSRTWGRS